MLFEMVKLQFEFFTEFTLDEVVVDETSQKLNSTIDENNLKLGSVTFENVKNPRDVLSLTHQQMDLNSFGKNYKSNY